MMTDPPLLRATGITVELGRHRAVDAVDLTVEAGQTLAVIGPNGSGKSTLLRALFGAVGTTVGSVELAGRPLGQLSRQQIARQVAVVNQERTPVGALLVHELVGLGRVPHRSVLGGTTVTDRAAVADAIATTRLSGLADRLVAELSGGERQRVMVARALAQQAPLLLLDEPTNHLDLHHQHELLALLGASGGACVLVLHDPNLAIRYAHQVLVLHHGRVVATGSPEEVCRPELFEDVYRLRPMVVQHGETKQLLFGGQAPPFHRADAAGP